MAGTTAAFLAGRSAASFSLAQDGARFTTGVSVGDGVGNACDPS